MTTDLHLVLEQLEHKEIIRHLASPEPEYSFKHTLTQETAYRSLLKPQRRDLHRAVARAYEELYPDRLDEFAPLLAEHFAQAGEDAKTLLYAVRAGDAAARVYANAEAIAHYSQALAVATRTSRGAAQHGSGSATQGTLRDLYLKRGRVFELSGKYQQALENYQAMQALARERADERLELEGLMASTTLHSIPGPANNPLLARGLAAQALALAHELGMRAAEAKIYWNLMLLENWGGGDPQRAVEFGEKSLALVHELNLGEQLPFTLHDLAMAYMLANQRDRAEVSQKQAAELWRASGNMPMYAESLNRTVLLYVNAGEIDAAITCGLQAYGLTRSIENLIGEALAAVNLSHGYAAVGEFDKALQFGDDAIRCSEKSSLPSIAMRVQNQRAWIYGLLGKLAKGIEVAEEGLKRATRAVYGEDNYRLELSQSNFAATLVRLELLKGNLTKAQQVSRQALQVVRQDNFFTPLFDGNHIFLAKAELCLAAGDYDSAREAVDQFLTGQSPVPARAFLPSAYAVKGKVLLAEGNRIAAAEAWQIARAEAEAMNLRPMLWPVLVALAELHGQQERHSKAAELLDEARAVIQFIADHSPADLRASFLALPQVRRVMAGIGAPEKAGISNESRH